MEAKNNSCLLSKQVDDSVILMQVKVYFFTFAAFYRLYILK